MRKRRAAALAAAFSVRRFLRRLFFMSVNHNQGRRSSLAICLSLGMKQDD